MTVPPLSAVVYALAGRIPRSERAPSIALAQPAPAAASNGRMQVRADVGGDSFYEVAFEARSGRGGWQPIGTDDNAPYRVFHDVSGLHAGTTVRYRATVRDNAGHTRRSAPRKADVPPPALTWDAPREGSRQRGSVLLRLFADPERATHEVAFERSVGRRRLGGDRRGQLVARVLDHRRSGRDRARHRGRVPGDADRAGRHDVTSAVRTIEVAPPPLATAVVHYLRPAGDYTGWGLHLWAMRSIRPCWPASRGTTRST